MWLWENRAMLVPQMSLKSLLFTIVKNKCLNNITHNQIKQRVHEKLYAKFENQFEDPDFYIEGDEIAERTGVSPKTIAYRISQSLKILRTELKEYMPLFLALLH